MRKNDLLFTHEKLKVLDKESLINYFDFITETTYILNNFEVWEAENVHSPEDDAIWQERVVRSFSEILNSKNELEDKLHEYNSKHSGGASDEEN